MLFELNSDLTELTPMAFTRYQKSEKQLEELLSKHLFDTLFEGRLLPFHQERCRQPEGDIYALDAVGDIFVFELKVATAAGHALDQLFRYTQDAGQWPYEEIERKFIAFHKQKGLLKQAGDNVSLAEAHKDAFDLVNTLVPEQFNRNQHMLVVGNAADKGLTLAVEFWKKKGLSIDFCPYRIFEIDSRLYFEFFAKPYDAHPNPGDRKGVLFDTCRTYMPEALKWMVEKDRVSAYGDRKGAVYSLRKNDIVFYAHGGCGLVAAARVTGNSPREDRTAGDERFWEVQFLTPKPTNFESPPAMLFSKVKEVTGKGFFWARILKVPYLEVGEAEHLLGELKKDLAAASRRSAEPGPTA